jgi:DNA-binding beta-propeller fold protein YncE
MSDTAAANAKPPVNYPPAGTPDLGYKPAPDYFQLPQGMNFGECSGVALNSKGNIFVLNRAKQGLIEFDGDGTFIRAMCDGLFQRAHGLRIDAEDNIWATDVAAHFVVKMNKHGRILMVLGSRGRAADWHPHGHARCFDEPNDLAFGANGEVYISQGHGKGESRISKFDESGKFLGTWGGEGTGPGQFNCPHSLVIDPKGLIHVADRSNQRIQVFDQNGKYVRESQQPGTPCGLCMTHDQHLFLAHGHEGKIMKLTLEGKVLGVTGSQGKGPNQYGEAHYIAADARDDIYVADTMNWNVQKLVKK